MKNVLVALAVVLSCGLSLIFYTGNEMQNETYRIGLPALPEKLDPRRNSVDYFGHILRQLYFPLLRIAEDGQIESEFVDLERSKGNSESGNVFAFCLKSGITFNDGSAVTVADLISSLEDFHMNHNSVPPIKSISAIDSCVTVTLEREEVDYYRELSLVRSTVLKRESANPSFPVGMGPYTLETFDSNKITMKARKEFVSGSVETVEFHLIETVEHGVAVNLTDWNFLPHLEIPDSVKRRSQSITRPIKRSSVLFVRHPSAGYRKKIAACIDMAELRKFVDAPNLSPLPGIVPRGFPGWDFGFKQPEHSEGDLCNAEGFELTFYNFKPEKEGLVKKIFSDISGLNIQVKTVLPKDLLSVLFSEQNMMSVIGLGSSDDDPTSLWHNIIGENPEELIIFERLPRARELLNSALAAVDLDEKDKLYREVHKEILNSHYFVPLGQLNRTSFYDSRIKVLKFADRVNGLPDIRTLRFDE